MTLRLDLYADGDSVWLIQKKQYGEDKGSYFRGRNDQKRGRTKGVCMQELESADYAINWNPAVTQITPGNQITSVMLAQSQI